MITVIIIAIVVIVRIIAALISDSKIGLTFDASTETPESQPYANLYGTNLKHGSCAVNVTASSEMSVVVIVRYRNIDGEVAGHLFIEKGSSGIICLRPGTYQIFFYSGRDWDPSKEMDCGLSGGFRKDEIFQEDPRQRDLKKGMMMTYKLRYVLDGNFIPASTDKVLFF